MTRPTTDMVLEVLGLEMSLGCKQADQTMNWVGFKFKSHDLFNPFNSLAVSQPGFWLV